MKSSKYPSGAERRKIGKRKQDEIKKIPKLTEFYGAKSNPSDNSANPSISSCSTAEIQQEAIKVDVVESSVITEDAVIESHECLIVKESLNEITDDKSLLPLMEINEDISLWPASLNDQFVDQCVKKGFIFFQHRSHSYPASLRKFKSQNRTLSDNLFKRSMKNGEVMDRSWLIYSPSLGNVFCFPCKLFPSQSKLNSSFASTGCSDWKHAEQLVSSHENSKEHRDASNSLLLRQHVHSRIDKDLEKQLADEKEYWTSVLQRVVAVIKFLALRGLAFRGESEIFGVNNNGNFLGILELLSQFDPFLKEHIKGHGGKGRGHTSYLSKTIYEDLVHLMGRKVFNCIIKEIKESKYYSLIIDSSPDCSHVDQLSVVFRYFHNGCVHERFLVFIPIMTHKGKDLFDVDNDFLVQNSINLQDCRGIATDNASNMAGMYNGFQAFILQKNDLAPFVPCAGHSLNLVGSCAVESCPISNRFFILLQKVYVHFSSSPRKWNFMIKNLSRDEEKKLFHLKSLSDTRWSRHFEAVKALLKNYDAIIKTLDAESKNEDEKLDVRLESKSIAKHLQNFDIVFMCTFWYGILERFNETSKRFQDPQLDLLQASHLFSSLKDFITDQRSKFNEYVEKALKVSDLVSENFDDESDSKRKRLIKYVDGNSENETTLSGRKKLEVETFLIMVDKLVNELSKREEAYKKFNRQFRFLTRCLYDENVDEISLQNFLAVYYKDTNDDLKNEIGHFYYFIKAVNASLETAKLKHCGDIAKYMFENKLDHNFPNLFTAFRIYLSIPLTSCEAERSFSKMASIKNTFRSVQLEERLNDLSILALAPEITQELDFEDIITLFSEKKARKKVLN